MYSEKWLLSDKDCSGLKFDACEDIVVLLYPSYF